ncbi:glycosyltransferase family 4 protein [Pontibacter chinhatensis]|uniref:Glycosyltransferase involved in cell wall bisynthesis n=1 Tax=Pontibacter chinhatensis TaxID=1436961 RepID=A0A1I2X097_9BACT|nr:glycosyltransferase [Pontibacter chinhatensis]SFH06437.1 Glycosyltransferase involved in cell wall bisynthesis [Pontibacter chinhatensis]
MRLAIFSPIILEPTLGATKHRIEQAKAMENHGWRTSLFDYRELGLKESYLQSLHSKETYSNALKNYLIANAAKYDVVLYEGDSLPYPRDLFYQETLFVASPSLLFYHFQNIQFPLDLKGRLKRILYKYIDSSEAKHHKTTWLSLTQADIVQVQNNYDKAVLIKNGFPEDKVITIPCGLDSKQLTQLHSLNQETATKPCVAFIGTFDFRKGAVDFPHILSKVVENLPDCTFKLLGTKGMFVDSQQVLDFFPKRLQSSITVVPTFSPHELRTLLRGCQVGMFPSYIESFGIGVLEMMAAGIPVVCYKSPGPSDFVPEDLLVRTGDVESFASTVIELLSNKSILNKYSKQVSLLAEQYNWNKIGADVSKAYYSLVKRMRQIEVQAAASA